MKKMLWILMLAVGIGILYVAGLTLSPAHAEQGWKEEFEAVCSKTDAAMTLSKDELKDLVGRCDRLMDRIGSEEETVRKIYLRRLKSCKDLYLYVLETKKTE